MKISTLIPFNREKMKLYQDKNWNRRVSPWGDFSEIGGDCTNYASQVIYAGGAPMIKGYTLEWYYYSYQNRSPSWTSAELLYNFLSHNKSTGPHGKEISSINDLLTGDLIQLDFTGDGKFDHTAVVYNPTGYLNKFPTITAHSLDRFNQPLNVFNYSSLRLIHLTGYM